MTPKQMGRRGGKVTASRRTPEQRSEAARKASQARWKAFRKATKIAESNPPKSLKTAIDMIRTLKMPDGSMAFPMIHGPMNILIPPECIETNRKGQRGYRNLLGKFVVLEKK